MQYILPLLLCIWLIFMDGEITLTWYPPQCYHNILVIILLYLWNHVHIVYMHVTLSLGSVGPVDILNTLKLKSIQPTPRRYGGGGISWIQMLPVQGSNLTHFDLTPAGDRTRNHLPLKQMVYSAIGGGGRGKHFSSACGRYRMGHLQLYGNRSWLRWLTTFRGSTNERKTR